MSKERPKNHRRKTGGHDRDELETLSGGGGGGALY